MFLAVDVGRVFSPRHVSVQLREDHVITVAAEMNEMTSCSRTSARLRREFDLSEMIEGRSVVASLGDNGVLKVKARVLSSDVGAHSLSVLRQVKVDTGSMNNTHG